VAGKLGAEGKAAKITPAKMPVDLDPSPALRLYGKTKPTLKGRKVGILTAAGFNSELVTALINEIEAAGAAAVRIGAKIQGERDSKGKLHPADMALRGSPSVLFDAVAVIAGDEGDKALAEDPNAQAFLMDAIRHCKAVGFDGIRSLAAKANLAKTPGIVNLSSKTNVSDFIRAAEAGRFWERELEK
jgi:catalase